MSSNNYSDDLVAIRSMMEKSSRFISLSGLSGIMAGIYSLIGAAVAYQIIYNSPEAVYDSLRVRGLDSGIIWLFVDAAFVILATVITGVYLTKKKAKSNNQSIWNGLSRRLLFNLIIPLVAGGIIVFIIYAKGYYVLIAPLLLVFYGFALLNASHYTLRDVRYLGISEVCLGIIAIAVPGFGLLFWTLGFGVLHIIYGLTMYLKYER